MQTVIGAFDDMNTAQRAVDRLVQSGFDRQDVHLQRQDATPASRAGLDQREQLSAGHDGQGGQAGRFGFFSNLFQDAGVGYQAEHAERGHVYDEAVRRGSAVVVVDAQDESQAERAGSLLDELGAIDVDERSRQWRSEGWQPPVTGRQEQGMPATSGADDLRANQEGVIDVVEEQLKVDKRTHERGGVRVIQRVSSKPVREMVRLREEHAVVERRPVDRHVTGDAFATVDERSVEVRESVEEAVIAKTARVVEEVRVGKEVREHEETIEDTVRRKDVDIERLGGERTGERERAFATDEKARLPASREAGSDHPATGSEGRTPGRDKPGR